MVVLIENPLTGHLHTIRCEDEQSLVDLEREVRQEYPEAILWWDSIEGEGEGERTALDFS